MTLVSGAAAFGTTLFLGLKTSKQINQATKRSPKSI
jgi:hypothetical protein